MTRRTLFVTLDYALRGVFGLLVALPIAGVVAGTGIGHFPEGDRLLFEAGGLVLAEVARMLRATLAPVAVASLGVALVLSVALVIPHAMLLLALSDRERLPLASFFARALERVPALLFLTGLGHLVGLGAWAVGGLAASGVRSLLAWGSPPWADVAALATLAAGALLALFSGLTRDVCRAAAVVHGLDGRDALLFGLRATRRQAPAALRAFFGPLVLSALLVGAGSVLTAVLDVGRPGAWRVVGVLLLHQAVAYALAWSRALWLSSSLDLVAQPSVSRR